jgi:hypothetical protein
MLKIETWGPGRTDSGGSSPLNLGDQHYLGDQRYLGDQHFLR